MPGATELQYLILRDVNAKPYLLARVLWPRVCHAISAQRPDWKDDPGLFDLPYDPSAESVTFEQATRIAADWGARLPSDETPAVSGPPMIRRMPPNWSNLSPAERRAWGLEFVKIGPRTPLAPVFTEENDRTPLPRKARRPWPRSKTASLAFGVDDIATQTKPPVMIDGGTGREGQADSTPAPELATSPDPDKRQRRRALQR